MPIANSVQTAIVIGATSILTAVLSSWLKSSSDAKILLAAAKAKTLEKKEEAEAKRLERQEDLERQDLVARQAKEAAELVASKVAVVASKAQVTAELLATATAISEAHAKSTTAQLVQIHALVNSNLTASLYSELGAHRALLVVLQKVTLAPDIEQIEATTTRIKELELQLADRLEQTRVADEARKQEDTQQ